MFDEISEIHHLSKEKYYIMNDIIESDIMKDNFIESPIKIGNNNEGNAVGNHNSVIINKQNNSSVSYEGDKEDVFFLNKISPTIIRKYGEKKLSVINVLSFIASIITTGLWINSFSATKKIPIIPQITAIESEWFLYSSVFLFAVSILLFRIISHQIKTTCKNCKKEFAYYECHDPLIEEIKTSKGIRKTIHRYYECKFCGDVHQTKIKEFVSET